MITTLIAMQMSSLRKALIIGGLCLLSLGLAGCNALRLGYSNGPTLAWLWIDGYADFDSNQSPAVKAAIGRWFDWHRGSQLPAYATLLAEAQADVLAPTTPEAACNLQERATTLLAPAADRAIAEAVNVVPLLDERQFAHMAQRYAKGNDEMKRDFMQADAAERRKASIKRTVERVERVYGRIGDAQRQVIEAGVEASPFDAEVWLKERERRQVDILQTLRRLRAESADAAARSAALRSLADRGQRSQMPEHRAYQQRLRDHNCAFAARIHNAMTPAQRGKARDTLKGWEDDLRSLTAAARTD